MRYTDFTGVKNHHITAIERIPQDIGRIKWKCLCDCGKTILLFADKFKKQKSCGCKSTEIKREKSTKHSHAIPGRVTGAYYTWGGIKARCYNHKHIGYKNYGGRGIVMCEEWLDFNNFMNDMGEKPNGTTMDRIDNDGPYSKENCRWATPSEQAANKRNTIKIDVAGVMMTLGEAAKALGVSRQTLNSRRWRQTQKNKANEK